MFRCTFEIFDNDDIILYYNKCIDYDKDMLVYELSDDINHVKMHREIKVMHVQVFISIHMEIYEKRCPKNYSLLDRNETF